LPTTHSIVPMFKSRLRGICLQQSDFFQISPPRSFRLPPFSRNIAFTVSFQSSAFSPPSVPGFRGRSCFPREAQSFYLEPQTCICAPFFVVSSPGPSSQSLNPEFSIFFDSVCDNWRPFPSPPSGFCLEFVFFPRRTFAVFFPLRMTLSFFHLHPFTETVPPSLWFGGRLN